MTFPQSKRRDIITPKRCGQDYSLRLYFMAVNSIRNRHISTTGKWTVLLHRADGTITSLQRALQLFVMTGC